MSVTMVRLVSLAAMMLAIVMATPAPAQQGAAQVRVDAVRTEPLLQTVPIIGRLVANQRGEVSARVAGAVQRLEVQVGDRLAAGDLIAVIDEGRLEARAALANARVLAANAQIEAERAELSLLEQERARLNRLRNSAAFSPAALEDKSQEIEAAIAAITRAEAQLDEALADLALAEKDVADARIIAPYPGVVTQRYISAGDYLQIGEPVVALIDDASLEIEADVPSVQVAPLEPGTLLTVNFDGAAGAEARLRAIVPDENPLTRTLAVRLELAAQDESRFLASGQSVTVNVPVGVVREVVTVDKDAVLRRGAGASVFVAVDGAAAPREVVLGEAVGSRFVVIDGLVPGDLVVVRGNERLRPGQALSYEPPQTAAQPLITDSAS